ncbi:M20/M25/M40 family metallo-hydrolase [Plastoroseomonas arctica]|nr:M20/M25/M40 family metallo-hydrolase [Plastoroseomonas arctica]
MTNIPSFLAEQRDRQVAFLAALVRTPSDNPPGDLAAAAETAAVLMEGLGLIVERHPVPAAACAAVGMVSCTNLVVRHRFGPGSTIALNAHGDVVPPGEGWTQDPYGAAIVDGWMVGRGAAVSKSDIATYAFALLALVQSGAALKGAVELHITYDEETGGEIGPLLLLEQGISKPDYAIGAGFSYAVVNAHNGCLHLEVELRGRSAHAAKPWTGADALEAATSVLGALYAWRQSLVARVSGVEGIGAPQLTVGLIEGGINTNVVPDRVVFRLDRRMVPEENAAEVEAELRALIASAAGGFAGIGYTVRRILLAAPLTPLPGSELLASALATQATRILGTEVGVSGVPLYTDARHYSGRGIPIVLYGAGPRSIEEANAHRADERLPLADLHAATEVVACAIAEILSR